MKPFCEIMVSDIFPTIRAMIAYEMIEELNHTQTEVAHRMGVTQPAVSQYMRELRGKKVEIIKKDESVYGLIRSSARDVAKAERIASPMILCNICKEMRKTGLLCRLHKAAVPALKDCTACFEGACGC